MPTRDRVRGLIGRLWAVDPIGPLLALAAVGLFFAHGLQEDPLKRDTAIYAYGAQQAAEGVLPYVSILNRAGPLSHLVPAVGVLGARLVGIDDLLGMRLLLVALSAGCVWVLYLAGRDLFSSRLAGAACAASLTAIGGFVVIVAGGPRDKPIMLFFLVCSLWAVVGSRWALAGVFVALATLTYQPAFFSALPTAVVGMAGLRGRAFAGALTRFAVGGLVPTALCVAGFALAGAFKELVDGFLLINMEYTVQSGALAHLNTLFLGLDHGWGLALWVVPVGMLACLAAAVRRLLDRDARREPGGMAVVGMGAGLVAGLLWCLRAYNWWPDTFALLPYAALGIGAIALAVRVRFPARVAVPAVGVWCALCLVAGLSHAISTSTPDNKLERQKDSVAAVLRVVPPDATILSAGSAAALVLSRRRNPTRHLTFAPDLKRYIDDTWPGGLAGYVAWVDETEPTLITVDNGTAIGWISSLLRSKYVYVGRAPMWQWYVLRSVGPSTIASLREVIRAAAGCGRQDTGGDRCGTIPG